MVSLLPANFPLQSNTENPVFPNKKGGVKKFVMVV
jgi:hypothetical protein